MLKLEVVGENNKVILRYDFKDIKKAVKDFFVISKDIDKAFDKVEEMIEKKLRIM